MDCEGMRMHKKNLTFLENIFEVPKSQSNNNNNTMRAKI